MRKPRDIDAELKTLEERTRELKARRITQLGELVSATGADSLPLEALAGALLSAVEQAKEKPEAVARWAERGQAFFRGNGKQGGRSKRADAGDAAPGASGHGAPAQTGHGPAP